MDTDWLTPLWAELTALYDPLPELDVLLIGGPRHGYRFRSDLLPAQELWIESSNRVTSFWPSSRRPVPPAPTVRYRYSELSEANRAWIFVFSPASR